MPITKRLLCGAASTNQRVPSLGVSTAVHGAKAMATASDMQRATAGGVCLEAGGAYCNHAYAPARNGIAVFPGRDAQRTWPSSRRSRCWWYAFVSRATSPTSRDAMYSGSGEMV